MDFVQNPIHDVEIGISHGPAPRRKGGTGQPFAARNGVIEDFRPDSLGSVARADDALAVDLVDERVLLRQLGFIKRKLFL